MLLKMRILIWVRSNIVSYSDFWLVENLTNRISVNATANYTNQYEIEKAEFASSFACLIGIFQILLGILQFHRNDFKIEVDWWDISTNQNQHIDFEIDWRLSFLLPPTVVKGFTTGLGLIFKPVIEMVSFSQPDRGKVPQEVFEIRTSNDSKWKSCEAFYIGTSQLRTALGIPKKYVPRPSGIGGLFITWFNICKNLPKATVSSGTVVSAWFRYIPKVTLKNENSQFCGEGRSEASQKFPEIPNFLVSQIQVGYVIRYTYTGYLYRIYKKIISAFSIAE